MKNITRFGLLAPVAVLSAPAFAAGATGPNFDTLTSAVDFTTTSEAVLSVGALAIGLTLVVLGIRKVMSMIRSA